MWLPCIFRLCYDKEVESKSQFLVLTENTALIDISYKEQTMRKSRLDTGRGCAGDRPCLLSDQQFCRPPISSGAGVTVTVDGDVYGTYSLAEAQEIDINGTNHLSIHDGEADMADADCPDKLCVHQRAISRDRETIVCLPNRVVVEVTGAEEPAFDSIAK